MIEIQGPKYFVWLKIISVIVIVTFVTTQFDARLAFGYSASQVPTPQDSALKNQLKEKEDALQEKEENYHQISEQLQETQKQLNAVQGMIEDNHSQLQDMEKQVDHALSQ